MNPKQLKLLENNSLEVMRSTAIECWKRWTDAGVAVTWEASVEQKHLDSWQELKNSEIDTSKLFLQGGEFFARAMTVEAVENALSAA